MTSGLKAGRATEVLCKFLGGKISHCWEVNPDPAGILYWASPTCA